ncbi:MAG TPA: serine hydrolase [Gemmatimonadaceae bacterium]|nr:serine hydrolase [Gemmatimonadaceae bacterium]
MSVRASLLLAVLPSLLGAQTDLGSNIDRIFARFDRTTPGCAVGLARDGRALYAHGYGMANLEYGVPLTDSTVLESGSVAKQFTASALVLLAEDGKLSLDDDIHKYLPEVPSFGPTITIRNLLTHTSGLRDQWGLLGIEGRGPGTQVHSAATTLDLVAHQKMLNFAPGSKYLYSNTGYALAGLIVQRVSGKTLDEFTRERLFRPLGMVHTRWRDDFTTIVPNRATAYTFARGAFHTDMPFTNMIGNGGLLSTVGDLMKWNDNLDHPTVGGPSYVDAMQTRMRLTSGRTITYALGLIVTDHDGVREISHSGSTAGYQTFLARYPDQHVSLAVWCNTSTANPTQLAHEVADLVLTKPPRAAAQSTQAGAPATRFSAAGMSKWGGTYVNPETDVAMAVAVVDSGLAVTLGNRTTMLRPVEGAEFRSTTMALHFGMRGPRRVATIALPDGDTSTVELVTAPTHALPLADYGGTYASDELDVQFKVVARDGKLYLQRRPADEFELRPTYADDFQAGGGLGSVRFRRDTSGRVVGFSFFAGRVLDVRFDRK